MKNRKIFTVILFALFYCYQAFSQEIDSIKQRIWIDDFLENTSENYFLFEDLNYLRNNPVNILSADKDDLLKLPLISEGLAETIIRERNKTGKLSKRELKAILNDELIYKLIEPYISFEPARKDFDISLLSSLSSEMQDRRGFDTLFEGNKIKSLSKILVKFNPYNITSAFTIEKDPGELKYYDHYSGFIKYETDNFKIITGDYRIAFNEGLTFGSGSLSFMGDDVLTMMRGEKKGLRAYNGTDENNYLRGISAEANISDFNAILFYSDKFNDANMSSNGYITSLYSSGLHRYDKESGKHGVINEKIAGGRILYFKNFHRISFNYYNAGYDKNFLGSGYYGLRGNSFKAYGIGYTYLSNQLMISAEAANNNTAFAGIINLGFSLNKDYLIYLNARKYPYNYNNPFSGSVSAGSNTQNEEGFSLGLKFSPCEKIEIDSYADIYRIPYRTYHNPLPSSGMGIMLKLQMEINESYLVVLRFREKNGDEYITLNDPSKGEIKSISGRSKRDYRIELNSIPVKNLFLRTRIEYNSLNYKISRPEESGYILYQDLLWRPLSNLLFNLRAMFFNTDSYETALYEHEREVTGIYSISALYDKGFRFYFAADYSFGDYLNLMLKYSNTTFQNKESIGSSYDELLGRSLSKISFELNVKI